MRNLRPLLPTRVVVLGTVRNAVIARPGLLVLYHGLCYGTEEELVLDEISAIYDGEVILADDLDSFTTH